MSVIIMYCKSCNDEEQSLSIHKLLMSACVLACMGCNWNREVGAIMIGVVGVYNIHCWAGIWEVYVYMVKQGSHVSSGLSDQLFKTSDCQESCNDC